MNFPGVWRKLGGLLLLATLVTAHAAGLEAGAARREITPPPELLNWVGHQPYAGVLDPVYVRAVVLGDGSDRVAIIALDLTDTREPFVAAVRGDITQATGIPADHILVNASHTHSAPWVPSLGAPLLEAEQKTLGPVEQGPGYPAWQAQLRTAIADAAREADQQRRPATLSIGRAWAAEVLFNRRPVRPDGQVETTYTADDPHALPQGRRFGPMDPTLTLLTLADAAGHGVASLFSLPCHSVSIYPFHKGISADWPGPVSARLRKSLGGESLFLQGCAGDIVPARRGLAARDEQAALVAARALAAWTNRLALAPAPAKLRARSTPVDLPLTPVARRDTGLPALRSEVQVLTLGPLAIVALPGEPMTGLSLELQRRSPFPHTLVLGYSNGGGVQYVGPTGDKPKGGYEMTVAGAGDDRCGDLLVQAAVETLDALAVEAALATTPRERLHLYLLIGQSNMAGRGTVEPPDQVPHARVLTLGTNGQWQLALDPLHHDRVNAGVGLGSAFGRTLADADPAITIGLIPAAVGGTPLSRWVKGGDLYGQALVRARSALPVGTLQGILWHQGENDADQEGNARSYADRLAQMLADLRADLGAGDVPVVAGELGPFLVSGKRDEMPHVAEINRQLATLSGRVPRFALAPAAGLTPMPDGIHFDSPSLREFGRRYAAALQALPKP